MTFLTPSFVKTILVTSLAILSGMSFAQSAPTTGLTANIVLKPAKCVSLRQGQVCYADVELQWQASQAGNYCLQSSTQATPLLCWNAERNGQFSGEISADKNVVFTLTAEGADTVLASAEMEMAWVYKKKRTAVSWRVF